MIAGTGQSDDSDKYGEKYFVGVVPLFSLKDNFNRIIVDIFKIRCPIVNAEHEDVLKRADGYLTAWMKYQHAR